MSSLDSTTTGKKSSRYFLLLLLIPLAIYFSLGVNHLAKFETADEHYWLYDSIDGRVHDYWNAISAKYWPGTRINDKPGITLAYVSGIGLFFEQKQPERFVKLENSLRQYNPQVVLHNNFVFRLPILIFNGLFSFFFFWAIRKLTQRKWLALFATTLILLNPVLLGISQIVNPDSLLWVFSFASFLSFCLYLEYQQKSSAVMASIFLGLALLSKYTAVIFIPFFFVLILIHLLYRSEAWSREKIRQSISNYFAAYFSIIVGALLLFALMMPAVFVDPSFLYGWTIGFKGMDVIFSIISAVVILVVIDTKLLNGKYSVLLLDRSGKIRWLLPRVICLILFASIFVAFLNLSVGGNFMEMKTLTFDAAKKVFVKQDFYDKFFMELYPLIFSLTPLALFSLFFIWVKAIFKKIEFSELVLGLSVFIIAFYAAVFKQDLLVTIRYTILLYPFVMLLSAIAIWDIIKYFRKIPRAKVFIATFTILIFTSLVSLLSIAPFYFNYTNNLLPKDRIITGSWGYGGYEAAQYLNALPNAENLTVWSDYWGFCPFFKGRCIQSSLLMAMPRKTSNMTIDYYVKSRRGSLLSKSIWNKLKKNMSLAPEWTYAIDGRSKNYISVYKARDPHYKFFITPKGEMPNDSEDEAFGKANHSLEEDVVEAASENAGNIGQD